MTAPLYAEIDLNRLPRHVAIIMDGNGRWAKQHKVKVAAGAPHRHRNAARDHPVPPAISELRPCRSMPFPRKTGPAPPPRWRR